MENEVWISRNITSQIREGLKSRPALFITGMRQTGKTSLLKRNFSDFQFVSFDKIENVREAEENPGKFLNSFSSPVVLDEAQYVPGIFREIKYRIDENRNQYGRWILTGSQNFLLMKDISESLAGRIGIFHLHTLSSNEIRNSIDIGNRINNSLVLGGFPEIWSNPNISPENFFDDYVTTYGERDLRRILDITNLRDFQRLLKSCAFRVGQLINYSDLARDVGVSSVTIKTWINALETGGLIYLLQPYYRNLGKRLIKAPKLYFSDSGLLCYLL
ncbi:MAG: ATP-binding protein [Leptospiraceae bacterium]|nr:ATP-binding protein [Leptospiraceae bacterium]